MKQDTNVDLLVGPSKVAWRNIVVLSTRMPMHAIFGTCSVKHWCASLC